MLVGLSLMVLLVIGVFSLVLGNEFTIATAIINVDTVSIINGSTTTYEITAQDVFFAIDTSSLINAGIAIIITIIAIATITGIQVLGSGLSPASVRIFILLTGYTGIWFALTTLSFNLITGIEIFGSIIYITITIAYTIGVVQKISGGNN